MFVQTTKVYISISIIVVEVGFITCTVHKLYFYNHNKNVCRK